MTEKNDNSPNYSDMDATALAELIKLGKASPAELLDEALAVAKRWNPKLNAIVANHEEQARQTAANVTKGPLAGVPFLLKDLGIQLKGTVTSDGSRFFQDAVAEHDSYITERYKNAGLVIFGKTAAPEFGNATATESLLWGNTRNPWNLDYSPGGSSGGSAAAVAAGIVPAANATDGGGSIRIPASCCGLFGLKPSRFRVPIGPGHGDGSGMIQYHAVTRSVRDSALLLDVAQGPEPGGYGSIPLPTRAYSRAIQEPPEKLRIGVMTKPTVDAPVHPDCLEAVSNTVRLCEQLGHQVSDITLPIDGISAFVAAGLLIGLPPYDSVAARENLLGRKATSDDIEPNNLSRLEDIGKMTAPQLYAARALQVSIHQQIAEFMKDYDVILSPTLAQLPGLVGSQSPLLPADQFYQAAGTYSLFTMLYNFTGQPAMSVPLHWNREGLPVGVQFAGRYAEEETLFQLAAQLERAQPWYQRRPAFPE